MKRVYKMKIGTTKLIFKLLLSMILFVSASSVYAQTGTIKGTIIDASTKEPLIGATVLLVGSSNGAATDLDGNYTISNVKAGNHSLSVSYIAFKPITQTGIIIESSKEVIINFEMQPDDYALQQVEVVAKVNQESENILLLEQRQALVATQSVGARELSRKGIGNAEAAVAQVSGISKQEGVKNVFVRGLGDRYNATLLNGFPVPSEDPEYKNIDLGFFGTDVIQNIGVNKVFSAQNTGDVGGAIIDISSKELLGDASLKFDLSAGLNSEAISSNFLRQDGINYFGFANKNKPSTGKFDFPNSLDPTAINLPMNHSYGLSGGKLFKIGENRNPLSFFVVASHSTDYSFTKEKVKSTNSIGTIYQDQLGNKYSQNTSQLVLANVDLGLNKKHNLAYNFMMVHANNQYVGEYQGLNTERHQDSSSYIGFLRRQQTNDNILLTNQFLTDWELSDAIRLDVGASYNYVRGLEPDRRENYLSMMDDGSYILTGSNRQKRFYSTLNENDFNPKFSLTYKLGDQFESNNSSLKIGYDGRFINDNFHALEYNFSAVSGVYPIESLKLDALYNQSSMDASNFEMTEGEANTYQVAKYIHSGYLEGNYQITSRLVGNLGLRFDNVDMNVDYNVQGVLPGNSLLNKTYFLPSTNLKYDINNKNVLRLGLSKTYTLPQSKEISPYKYVNISFVSQGDPNIQPSDNYNIDLKWDYYLSPSELFSLTGFYKYIKNPIARADEGNSAGLLTYKNISDQAQVAGIEIEARKNIFNNTSSDFEKVNKLSIGLNASYIYSNLVIKIANTEARKTQLEGASPFLGNFDISYNYQNGETNLISSLVLNYFSNRIHTIGTRSFKDIIEEGVPTLDFVTSYKFNKNITLKLSASNLFDPSYKLTRKASGQSSEKYVLNEYKKGRNISLGLSYEL